MTSWLNLRAKLSIPCLPFLFLYWFFLSMFRNSCNFVTNKVPLIEQNLEHLHCTFQLLIPLILALPVYNCFTTKASTKATLHPFSVLSANHTSSLFSYCIICVSFLIKYNPLHTCILFCKSPSSFPACCETTFFAITNSNITLSILSFSPFLSYIRLEALRCSRGRIFRFKSHPVFGIGYSRDPCFLLSHSRLTFLFSLFFSFFISNTLSYEVIPTVYSVYPSLGPVAGGTACLLTGANFESNSTYCNFSNYDNYSQLVRAMDVTSSSVICESPPYASVPVFVEVITEQAKSTSRNKLVFLYTGTCFRSILNGSHGLKMCFVQTWRLSLAFNPATGRQMATP
jgi:hypothetical protein